MAVFGLARTVSAQATTVTTAESVPLDVPVFVPCASESVTLTGNLEIVNHTTSRPDGSVNVVTHLNPHVNAGQQFTFVNIMRFVGQGPGNNFMSQQDVHVTVNAKGTTTTVVDNVRADCS